MSILLIINIYCCLPCYYSNKPGNNVFLKWSQIWERESGDRIPAGPKAFLIDQYLPVWVRCTAETCRKWRKLPPSIDLRHVKQDIVKCSNCIYGQDEVGHYMPFCRLLNSGVFIHTSLSLSLSFSLWQVISMVMNPEWINTVSYTPLLRHTMLTPLLSEYVPDGVGISPTTVHHMAVSMVTSQQQQQQQAGSPTTVARPKNGKSPPPPSIIS